MNKCLFFVYNRLKNDDDNNDKLDNRIKLNYSLTKIRLKINKGNKSINILNVYVYIL